jgi:hypothetical protein
VPFVLIQIVMIVLVLSFPQLVGSAPVATGDDVLQIELPTEGK